MRVVVGSERWVFVHMGFNELYTELLSRRLALIWLQMESDYVIERSAE
jgi:hypothetical protein